MAKYQKKTAPSAPAKKAPQASSNKPKNTEEVLNWVSQQGRGGDTMLAHVSRGELVIPNSLLDAEDAFLRKVIEGVMEEYGYNPGWFTVGHEMNSINPETGLPEFGWFSKAWKAVTKPIKKVAKAVTKVVKKVVVNPAKQIVKAIGKATGITPDVPEAAYKEQPSQATATTGASPNYEQDAISGKAKKATALRRRRRGKRRLRVAGDVGIGTSGQGSGVGTGGSTGGSSINVPRG
jgi:hypothetical protein